ncbi:hypothetical protein K443DRAFT_679471 [Laccaria amethystina LaAM-08-1]|uniref:Uncharacterized protein n=1 Tax=Laccaria amethystina LaAM-08-1 TaxID=1095629 RepID=A0A0C9XEK6_9AGAR|nr:hypothetical protein K443DRAFT_679471 [Laccaria amethystina LaAM-08-1]
MPIAEGLQGMMRSTESPPGLLFLSLQTESALGMHMSSRTSDKFVISHTIDIEMSRHV